MCGIYKVTNKINGKIYIGKSIDIKRRWQDHIWESSVDDEKWLANYRGVRTYFHSAIRKYGKDNFIWEIIEECDESQLNNKERFWIKELESNNKTRGYNMTEGGDGYNFGHGENSAGCKITLEQSNLIKQKLKERWTAKQIQEIIPQISNSAIHNINYGISWFDEKETYPISINNGHRTWSDEEAMKIKIRYAKGETINDLAKELNVRQETISALVTGKSYINLPILKREVNWKRINQKRKFTKEEVLNYRNQVYQEGKSIMSVHNQCDVQCTYAAFYNMIKGITYKNIGGLPQ